MFRTVRHWWSEGSGQHTARLFAFELTVVILGVLIAQGLANWAGQRQQDAGVAKEAARLRFETGRARNAAQVWQAAIPCLRARVDQLLHAATAGTLEPPLTVRDLAMPKVGTYSVEPFNADVERAFRDRYGDTVDDIYGGIMNNGATIKSMPQELSAAWSAFGYLAPDMGAPGPADRAAMRAAGLRLRWLLDRMAMLQGRIEGDARKLGIVPLGSGNALSIPDVPVTSCAEIWRHGHIWHAVP
ncbi:hypothetical protein ABDK56_08770 [Sphingomonas sp. ASV193]|uniref:hypothetical protein n=1 Tax=Sphingomonas sp. ASV193 TaxID=3144405 RepID=UPI0032E855E0